MSYEYYDDEEYEEYLRRRRAAKIRRRRKRRRIRRIKRAIALGILLLVFILFVLLLNTIRKAVFSKGKETEPETAVSEELPADFELSSAEESDLASDESENPEDGAEEETIENDSSKPKETPYAERDPIFFDGYSVSTEGAGGIGDDVISTKGILIDLDNQKTVAQQDSKSRIVPASMTKILTLLVAAEHISDLQDTTTITIEVTDFAYRNDCSAVGFAVDEVVTIEDLMYGTILPSGGDAAYALALYVAGSQEAFVDLMNQKLEELGLSATTHFTNCVGLYDDNHYSTCYDMAMILKAAEENVLCRKVLDTHIYTTSSTEQHPDGIQVSNWFLRRIEDKDTHGYVAGAKTGFVNESLNCAASYCIANDGTHYICVTVGATSSWRCIYDHVRIYSRYLK